MRTVLENGLGDLGRTHFNCLGCLCILGVHVQNSVLRDKPFRSPPCREQSGSTTRWVLVSSCKGRARPDKSPIRYVQTLRADDASKGFGRDWTWEVVKECDRGIGGLNEFSSDLTLFGGKWFPVGMATAIENRRICHSAPWGRRGLEVASACHEWAFPLGSSALSGTSVLATDRRAYPWRKGGMGAVGRSDFAIPGEISSEWSPVIARGIVTGRPILAVSRNRGFRLHFIRLKPAA